MDQIITDHGNVGSINDSKATSAEPGSKYCYLFLDLAKTEARESPEHCAKYYEKLHKLADVLDAQHSSGHERSKLPAIYTYFGQFVNHDISAPTPTPSYTSSILNVAKTLSDSPEVISAGPDAVALMTNKRPYGPDWLITNIENQHPHPLMLYSLYGTGPGSTDSEIRSLYDPQTMKFRLGRTFDDPGPTRPQSELNKILHHDLVREGGVARIADRRNDENVVIGQLHLAFMLFHNRAVDDLKKKYPLPKLFEAARAYTTRHYRYCVQHDFLKRIVPDESAGSQSDFNGLGMVPFEFTTAAFRFGHSMISQNYDYNRFFGVEGIEGRLAKLPDLFHFTSRRKMGTLQTPDATNPGDGPLPTHWVIDWARFLQVSNGKGSAADVIDTKFADSLVTLGDLQTDSKMKSGLSSIIHRNLKRGYHRFMPSGQAIADKLHVAILDAEKIRSAFTDPDAPEMLTATGFDTQTPLWVYFLCEAKVLGGGSALGPAAGAIVRGTIQALLKNNPVPKVHRGDDTWTPETSPLKLPDGGAIKDIKTFLQFAGVLELTPF